MNIKDPCATPIRHVAFASLLCASILTACGGEEAAESSNAPAVNPVAAPTQASDPVATGTEAITEAAYRRHIEILASDEFGGRAPASPGEDLTVEYLEQNFRRLGLGPANGDSYIQDVPLNWIEVNNSPDLVINGGNGEDLVLEYASEQVLWTRQQVEEAAIKDSELVFVGYGINAPERGWNDYADVDVTGKTVVILINDPGYATQNPELFNGNAMTYYGRWDYKFDEAARQGAAGALMIHDTLPAAYPWSTVTNSWTGRKFNMVLPDKGEGLASVEGWIARESAEALFNKAGLDLDVMYEKAVKPGFSAIQMGLNASAALTNETQIVNSRNVAAILKGSEAPDEIFIYMAHWDHFGTDPSLEGDQIYNGAMDNASGTAALLEMAKAYAALPQAPRRSVLFLAVTAEEQGLLGSLYYASNPLFPLTNTVGGLNMDGMNNFGSTRDITVVGLGMSDLDAYLAAAAAAQERVVEGDREAEKGYYFRSDHFELAKQGVPMLYPKKGYDDRERGVAYGMKKAREYTADHYHRVSDEYDLSWDVSGALEDMKMYFKTGLDVANSDDWPNWKEGTEFRTARDDSLEAAD
ncbi:MAG: M28 family peptidase [Gammaproteobacteria bacterium]|jgi:Zn-dependent M28 family amino/carboxypeptidase|nr:M28 family peptidase [Gammaproteobacteria bacterium]